MGQTWTKESRAKGGTARRNAALSKYSRLQFIPQLALLILLTACTPYTDAGCLTYAAQRDYMPRPLQDTPEGRFIAATDAALTGACR